MVRRIRKVLILGSGALKIGEAGEFDYSGSQAIKALKEENIKTILINPNIATVQTSKEMADRVYFLPVNAYFAEEVIKREKPDGIMLSFGGQTALNCGVELYRRGVLRRYNVEVLGSPAESIITTEDRAKFKNRLKLLGINVPDSVPVNSPQQAVRAAEAMGYPVLIRIAYALGGLGSGIAHNKREIEILASKAFAHTNQLLVERYLKGWKEIEYEVVRDRNDNCITVCNMENLDPMGVHTGESIVVAPSQTLSNEEYHRLRGLSLRIIRALGIVGECNIQFALNPNDGEYAVIEVNARLSRSSALASKATGYPLAFIAAKLSLDYSLPELKNTVTGVTSAFFEPALDYVVVKIPRWDLSKFKKVDKSLGSEMKSVGEVMAIGRRFEEALQKAVRMINKGWMGITPLGIDDEKVREGLATAREDRLFIIASAIKKGWQTGRISSLSGIDPWFIDKIRNIIELAERIKKRLTREALLEAKRLGFSDEQIAALTSRSEEQIRRLRVKNRIFPVVKQIDTLAAEFPARTNYLYLTYNGSESDVSKGKRSVIVLGSGAYRIGSSVEFDWSAVNTVITLRKMGYSAIMVNYNPETVSTDYDMCDRLYFDEISFETIRDIYNFEKPIGIILAVGGQIANNLAMRCSNAGMNILGTRAGDIDRAEDRNRFSDLLDSIGVDQPEWIEARSMRQVKRFAKKVGYPLLIRPSYVLSGSAMSIAQDDRSLEKYLKRASIISKEHPVVISKFYTNAREIEIDAVADNGRLVIWSILEHVENAGVHSGDSTMALPPQRSYMPTIRRIKAVARSLAHQLRISGPFNVQFIAKRNKIKVIECNLRASRSFPFSSKTTGYNFIEIATKIMMGGHIKQRFNTIDIDYVGVKAPQFSFSRLKGADPVLDVEMISTGEVACFGDDMEEALLKSLIATGIRIPEKSVLLSLGGDENKVKFLESARLLMNLGFRIYATEHTALFLKDKGINCEFAFKVREKKKENVIDIIKKGLVEMVINITDHYFQQVIEDEYMMRRAAVDFSIPLITNLQLAKIFIHAIAIKKRGDLRIVSWDEYLSRKEQ